MRRKKEAMAIDTTERCAYKCAALRRRRLADKNLRKRRLKTLFMQILLPTKLLKGGNMAKFRLINHEYYANYETCRNKLFDQFDPDEQEEDYHLDYYDDTEGQRD